MNAHLRILHLEDSEYDAELIQSILHTGGISCTTVRVDNGAEFESRLRKGGFDLIISDFSLPSFDGISALSVAQRLQPDVPFIFVSAAMGEERAIDTLKRGATDYVLKQRLSRLVHVVRRAMAEVEERNELRRTERALRESEETFRLITDNITDMIALLDLEGRRLYNSPSYSAILGDPAQLRGTNSFDEIVPEDRERIIGIFRETVRTGTGQRAEYRLRDKNGLIRIIESQASVIKNQDGTPASVVVVSRDITERKNLEQQLLHAQKMESIGTLAGGIAHDFNNVLGILLGYTSLLAKGDLPQDKIVKSAESMMMAIERGASLVRQLLTFARRTDADFIPLHLNGTIREVISMCSQTFPKTISFVQQLDSAIPPLLADHNQLHSALLNLCVNARDAMPAGGTITITTRTLDGMELQNSYPDATAGSYAHIMLEDTGSGMEKEVLGRIFEPFFTTKRAGKGTGLGLSMVYGVIKSHHGFIDVASERGKGTTFHMYLPLPASHLKTRPTQAQAGRELAGGSETILFAEDEEAISELVRACLEQNGYHVYVARDGMEALEVFHHNAGTIDLVLTDLGLPKLEGWDALRRMKEIRPDLVSLVATGYLDPDVREEMLREGVRDFVDKPYSPDQLLRKIRTVLDTVRRHRE